MRAVRFGGPPAFVLRAFPLNRERYGGDMKRFWILAAPAILAACGPADNEPGPGGVTVGEARALDEAAEMIEQKRLPPQGEPGAEEQPGTPAEPTE